MVYGQLVLITRALADVQTSNETHQFKNDIVIVALLLGAMCVCQICVYLDKSMMPGLNCLPPEGQPGVKAPGRMDKQTHTNTHTH